MIQIKAKKQSNQFKVELTNGAPLDVKRAHPSPINHKVYVTKEAVSAVTSGNRAKRLCDAIDEVMEAYEEEFDDFSRVFNINIPDKSTDVYAEVVDYILASLCIEHATLNGVPIR